MRRSRFAIFGAGFWAQYQLAAWQELKGAECVAIYNRTLAKAETLAQQFGVRAVYDDPEELPAREKLDFIDVITDVDTQPIRPPRRATQACRHLPEADGGDARAGQ